MSHSTLPLCAYQDLYGPTRALIFLEAWTGWKFDVYQPVRAELDEGLETINYDAWKSPELQSQTRTGSRLKTWGLSLAQFHSCLAFYPLSWDVFEQVRSFPWFKHSSGCGSARIVNCSDILRKEKKTSTWRDSNPQTFHFGACVNIWAEMLRNGNCAMMALLGSIDNCF